MARLLHWGVAVLLIGPFALAWAFSALGPGERAAFLVAAHRSLGLTVLAVSLVRLGWRVRHPLPPLPPGTARWESWLSRAVQTGLYACLLGMPLLGWAGSSARGDVVELFGLFPLPDLVGADQDLGDALFETHQALGIALLGLIALHAAGALRHHFVKRDGVLRSMVTGVG